MTNYHNWSQFYLQKCLEIQLTKSNPKIIMGVNPPYLMPIRVKDRMYSITFIVFLKMFVFVFVLIYCNGVCSTDIGEWEEERPRTTDPQGLNPWFFAPKFKSQFGYKSLVLCRNNVMEMEKIDKGLTAPVDNWWIWKTQLFWVHRFAIASFQWKSVKINRITRIFWNFDDYPDFQQKARGM